MKPAIALASILLLSSCTSSRDVHVRYNEASGETTYSSTKMLAGNVSMTGGLASEQRVMMQAFAACDGRACTPSEIEVAFFNESSGDLNLDYRRVEIVAGEHRMEWEDALRLTEPPHFSVPRGEFIRLPLNRAHFRALATARDVEIIFGLTGTTPLHMPLDRRGPLLKLLELIENP